MHSGFNRRLHVIEVGYFRQEDAADEYSGSSRRGGWLHRRGMMPVPTLVTGAAGRVGAVGRTVTELLLKSGTAVRAMVRTDDERAQALRDMGAEVVVGSARPRFGAEARDLAEPSE